METTRLALYERLPEIHRVRDADQEPPYPLRAWVGLVEGVLGEVHRDIGRLYRDLFIETCADWVVPYIGDLLGAGHLSGDPWTLRADVAQTIALRRRKGTLAGIERATYALTRWAVHCVELRERLAWCQHLNHQRPDAGGEPPYARADRFTPVRGGTAAIRDPAMLSLTGTPFDPWARVADLRPPAGGAARPNLPNLAVFLWRLEAYRVRMATPAWRGTASYAPSAPASGDATRAVRFDLNPLSPPGAGVPPAPLYPVRLFNAWNFDPRLDPPVVTALDHVPGPMLRARLDDDSPAGNPRAYLAIEPFDPGAAPLPAGEVSDAGVQLHLPQATFAGRAYPEGPGEPRHWRIRGANLCAWETTVRPPLRADEVLVDPELGRIVIGVGTMANGAGPAEAAALQGGLRVTFTYAAPGPVGAHPVSRPAPPAGAPVTAVASDAQLAAALGAVAATGTRVIEIGDSATYTLDPAALAGLAADPGGDSITVGGRLVVRAASGERPVIKLAGPLRFRAANPAQAEGVAVRFEGVVLARAAGFPAGAPLVARAAVDALELVGCTLDPGGHLLPDGVSRAPLRAALELHEPYDYATPDELAFDRTPAVVLQNTVAGALRIDGGYALTLNDSVVDAGGEVGGPDPFAIAAASGSPGAGWGPPLQFSGLTMLGRARVESVNGRGGVFTGPLEALDDQRGCVRYSCFSGRGDRIPQNLGCVQATTARLLFSGLRHGDPGYARVADAADFRIRERGPGDEAMGAYGFLHDASRLRNLRIRWRELMPVGVRPLLLPVT